MSALLDSLRQRDIRITANGNQLDIDAPAGRLTPQLVAEIRSKKAIILADLRFQELLYSACAAAPSEGLLLTPGNLLNNLSRDDYQDEQLMTSAGLEALARCVQATMMRQNGQVPPGWTSITTCRRCGPVWIFPGTADSVYGCPWCHSPRDRIPRAELSPDASFTCGAASRT